MSLTTLHEGRYLRLLRTDDGYEYAQRTNARGIVVIIPITDEGKVVLIEQPRPPVGATVVEFPAGLAGDIPGSETEPLEEAARRELLEETGFSCRSLERLVQAPPSPGMVSEIYTVFLATGLERVDAGGGDHTEAITVHEVALASVVDWLTAARERGHLVAMTVYAGLGLLALRDPAQLRGPSS